MSKTTDIFGRLIEDHDRHRQMLRKLAKTHGDTPERRELFEQFTLEAKSHAAAEEQALYSTMMRKPKTTDETRHSVSEHHEIEEMLNDLAATEMSSSAWLSKFKHLRHDFLHHIDEEEDEVFPMFEKYLDESDLAHMKAVFERRKRAEKADAKVTPEKMEDAKE